jgi:uncharacterized protein
LLFFSVSSLINVAGGLSMHYWPPEQIQEFSKFWQPPLELVEQEISAYQSGYWGQMDRRISDVLMMHTQAFPTWGFWRATGCMLFGMALFKLGFFSGKRPAKNYWTFLAIGIFIGLPTVLIGIQAFYKNDWHVSQFFLATQYNYWGSLLVSLGWISLVMLCIQKGILENLQLRLAAIGQLAFTNYLLQTIICTTIFYGHGLGLYGKVSRVSQLLIVIMIWVIQLMLSPEWLKKFRMGPFEWIWRSAAYMKTLPIRR